MIVDLLVASFWTTLLVLAWSYFLRNASVKWGHYLPAPLNALPKGILAAT